MLLTSPFKTGLYRHFCIKLWNLDSKLIIGMFSECGFVLGKILKTNSKTIILAYKLFITTSGAKTE